MSEYEERRKRHKASRDDERYSRHSGYRERDSRTEERESRSSRDLRDTIREHNGRRESDNYSSNKLERRSFLDSKEPQNHSSSKEYQSRSRSRDRTNEKRHSRYSPDRRESRNSHEEKKYEKDYYNEREYIRDEGYSREYRRRRDYSTDRDQTSDYRRDHELEYTEKRRRPESVERRSRDYPIESVDVTKAAAKAAEIAVKEIEEKFQKRREKMENWKKEKEKDLQEKAARVHIEEEEEQEIDLAKELKGNYPTELDVELPDFEAEKISEEKPKKKFLFGKPVKDAMGKKAITFGMTKTIVQKKLEQKTLLEDAEDRDLKLKPVLEPKMDQNGVQESMKTDLAVMDIDAKFEAGIDPLDSFMEIVERERYETSIIDENKLKNQKPLNKKQIETVLLQDDPSEEDEEEFVPQIEVDQEDIMAQAAAQIQKKKELAVVDHSKMNYEPFRKNFYMEPPELAELNEEEVNQKRLDLDGIKVRGAKCPKPVEKWSQFGMPAGVHEVIKKFLKYEYPTPIQAQAIPAIMSGRDVIGIAKTGSGKTIGFLLPLFRHLKDQRLCGPQEGPIALILTPTRELAMQIYKECKHFTKILNIRAICCYGGSPIRDHIAQAKRGAEIIICTPGRMMDLLCANGGRVTNLKRVTYLVLDEADRMFDMGFEPQVMKILDNIRPDRQTVLFSATFPRFMESLARRILQTPIEIIVGAKSVVAPNITQIVEVHQNEDSKFLRLLAILGKASSEDPSMKMLIFVDRQEAADNMMGNLFKRGYPCLSLHGGKDQADRDSVIQDFKNNAANILVATSVAARGLDVKDLKYVVNYDCPNHMEDYVHRCGRTGRAGNSGTAYTFVMPAFASRANDICKALKASNVPIPRELKQLADKFMSRVRLGVARISGSGFGGRGLERLIADRDATKKIQMREHGREFNEEIVTEDGTKLDSSGLDIQNSSDAKGIVKEGPKAVDNSQSAIEKTIQAAKERAARLAAMTPAEKALQMVVDIGKQRLAMSRATTDAPCWAEVEVNDYPQQARFKITSKEQIQRISEVSGTAITARGVYVPPGRQPPPGERKLYLFIEGDNPYMVDRAKLEMKDILKEATVTSMENAGPTGRYKVV